MTDHKQDRQEILKALKGELVGPASHGRELDFSKPIAFPDGPSSYGPWVQVGSGEEVLQRDRPTKRYGIGVLYPLQTPFEMEPTAGAPEAPADPNRRADQPLDQAAAGAGLLAQEGLKGIEAIAERAPRGEGDSDDFELSTANGYRPSTMAVTFLAEFPAGSELAVEVSGGRYRPVRVTVGDSERTWWLRSPVSARVGFQSGSLLGGGNRLMEPDTLASTGLDGLTLKITAYARPQDGRKSLVTVALTNRAEEPARGTDELCLFQARFTAGVSAGGQLQPLIQPYPHSPAGALRERDPEEQSFELLYRNAKTFAVGHGCAAGWATAAGNTSLQVSAEAMPVVEVPSITPEVLAPGGKELKVPMGPLAGLDPASDGLSAVTEVIDSYESWLSQQEATVPSLEPRYRPAAERHLAECRRALARMRDGLAFLEEDRLASRAFRLANHAVLLQQLRGRRTAREVALDSSTGRFAVQEKLTIPDWRAQTGKGAWRPFQIAFLLSTLRSIADGTDRDRETVELIWFPTGGGKTEAYLGLAAFALFYRRLRNPSDTGVEVLMRYTLRLLTAQQFQRAAALICAMESLRGREQGLGEAPFSIGIWLGGAATPNTRADARYTLRKLNEGDRFTESSFLLLRCPWCSAQMGPIKVKGRVARGAPRVAGYIERSRTVQLFCPDRACEFAAGLPVLVIDEDIYENPPSMIIGTVDKFALLAWKPEARALFGLAADGTRISSPPQLIIQDELHLISGPLGSMVGLYETVIEDLCTDRRGQVPIRPKIVSSTATIRRYTEQIQSLYARDDVMLFPPRALNAGDSFFARYARGLDGALSPGCMYVGVHGSGLGSVQTAQVRTFAALLQAPVDFGSEARDPWWTLMVFFNSLRELGTSLSLLQSDIPDYLRVLQYRYGAGPTKVRWLRNILELTSRLRSDEVPRAIERLSQPAASGSEAVDVCLASNIIEVGIDIDRLSLMAVVGQPKTTAQYIQVTGRVGRLWRERPGLVVTIFSPSKPRDRSHFEKFRSYHERLYAQVEPASVTPFSPPVLNRALHAALCSYVRQHGPQALQPWPVPGDLIGRAFDLLLSRVESVDRAETGTLKRVFEKRRAEWQAWQRTSWSGGGTGRDIPLLRGAGEYASPRAARLSWATPTSMRNVDAECRAEVTRTYLQEGEEAADV